MDYTNLNSFLKLGYFLDFKNENIDIEASNIDKRKYENFNENELIEMGSNLWREGISANFKTNRKHLVPISGGLDSRAILAGLLEHTEAKNIYTYTFGTPNTLDYEVGNYVSKKLGTNHTSFDLTQYIFKQEELENISQRIDMQTILFHHAPIWEVDEKYSDCQNWSGFMGDPIAGSKLNKTPSKTFEEAAKHFIKKNTYVNSIDLTNGDNINDLVKCDCINRNLLTLDEQIDFQNRQMKYIAPHVLMSGYDYKLPFLNPPWINFMLSIDNKFRINENLYRKILLNCFPKEFAYKTKTKAGLRLSAPDWLVLTKKINNKFFSSIGVKQNFNINYLDFNKEIRKKKSLKQIIVNNVMDLQERNILEWINLEEILEKHMKNKSNYADALITLASLEIHLKNGKLL